MPFGPRLRADSSDHQRACEEGNRSNHLFCTKSQSRRWLPTARQRPPAAQAVASKQKAPLHSVVLATDM